MFRRVFLGGFHGNQGMHLGQNFPPRSAIFELLHEIYPLLVRESALVRFMGSVVFAGDTHGDVVTTKAVLRQFGSFDHIVFLGDYIDREPEEGWALENIITLFQAKAQDPERIILLRGNHEANAIIPCFPCEFDQEIRQEYDAHLNDEFATVFNELPLMAMGHGIFAAHGGFPVDASLHDLETASKSDRTFLEPILWNDPAVSKTFRGVGQLFSEDELLRFLDRIHASVFVRSHDYQRLGEAIYEDHCLTLFTARQYQTMGNTGILVASTDTDVSKASDLHVENFASGSWQPYHVTVIND